MKRLLFAPLTFLLCSVYAQEAITLYYDQAWNLTHKDLATYYRFASFDTTTSLLEGEVMDFTSQDVPLMKGSYYDGKKTGEFTFFYENGKTESIGKYLLDRRTGLWKFYYSNGVLKAEVKFLLAETEYLTFNDPEGNPLLKDGNGEWQEEYPDDADPRTRIIYGGPVKDHKRNGEWYRRLESGKPIYKEKWKYGVPNGRWVYNDAGKLLKADFLGEPDPHDIKFKATESFAYAEGVNRHDYPFLRTLPEDPALPENQGEIYAVADEPAFPEGGMNAFYKAVGEEITYPALARKMRVQGRVFVEFVINTDGSLSNVQAIKGIGAGCDEEAVRVVRISTQKCKWHPATLEGKLVRQRHTLPLIFKLD